MNGYKINNLPNYVADDAYVICTWVDEELWYYGSYKTYDKAEEVAQMDEDFIIIH